MVYSPPPYPESCHLTTLRGDKRRALARSTLSSIVCPLPLDITPPPSSCPVLLTLIINGGPHPVSNGTLRPLDATSPPQPVDHPEPRGPRTNARAPGASGVSGISEEYGARSMEGGEPDQTRLTTTGISRNNVPARIEANTATATLLGRK